MMRSDYVRGGVLGLALAAAGCGGGGSPNSTGPSPTTQGPSTASAVVSVTGDRGAQSFNPNPVTPGAPLTVAWQNADSVVHRMVANDNSFDTGNVGANSMSPTVTVPSAGVNYHCAIHPGMVGAINGSSGTAPPCTGPYCAP
jgi:plastocyanin